MGCGALVGDDDDDDDDGDLKLSHRQKRGHVYYVQVEADYTSTLFHISVMSLTTTSVVCSQPPTVDGRNPAFTS